MTTSNTGPTDVRRLRRELEQTKRRLSELENGRALRLLKFARKSISSPKWGLQNLDQVPALFKTIPKESLPGLDLEIPPAAPGLETGSFMLYPNLKVLSIGDVPDLTPYCYHLRLENPTWLVFEKVGIDIVLLSKNAKITGDTIGLIRRLEKNGAKLMSISIRSDVSSTTIDPGFIVDLQAFNPIGIDDNQNKKPIKTISRQPSKLSKDNLLNYSAVICRTKAFKDEMEHAQAVLNILSCGILAVTDKTKVLSGLLPKNFPYSTNTSKTNIEKNIPEESLAWKRQSVEYRRFVHLNYSPSKLADLLAQNTKVPEAANIRSDKVSVILSTTRPDYLDNALHNISSQTHKNKELLLILHGQDSFNLDEIAKRVKGLDFPTTVINRPAESIFGENLNIALDKADGFFVTKMDDDDYYGPNHLKDLLAAMEYSRATIVGKWTNTTHIESRDLVTTFSGGREEKFVQHLPGATLFTVTDLLRKVRFGHVKRAIDTELYRRLETRGGVFYSTHSLNFIRVRHDKGHTYDTDIEDFIAHSSTKPQEGLKKQSYFA